MIRAFVLLSLIAYSYARWSGIGLVNENHIDNLIIAAGTYDGIIGGWEFNTNASDVLKPVFSLKSHIGCVKDISTHRRYMASGGEDETVHIFDLWTKAEVGQILEGEGTVTAMSFFSNHLLIAGSAGLLSVHRISDWEPLHTIKAHRGAIASLSVHPTGRLALTIGHDKYLKMWNLMTGRNAYIKKLPQVADLVQWSPEGTSFAIVVGKSIKVYDAKTGDVSLEITLEKPVMSIKYAGETNMLVGCEDKNLYVYNVKSGKCLHKLSAHTSRIRAVDAVHFDENTYYVASACSNGRIAMWKLTLGEDSNESDQDIKPTAVVDAKARITCLAICNPSQSTTTTKKKKKSSDTGKAEDTNKGVEEQEAPSKKSTSTPAKGSKKRKQQKQEGDREDEQEKAKPETPKKSKREPAPAAEATAPAATPSKSPAKKKKAAGTPKKE